MQLRRHGKHLPIEPADDIESAVSGGCSVIGMAFQPRADLEKFTALKRTLRQFIQSIQNAEPNGGAAPETARRRNVAGNGAGKSESPERSTLEKRLRGRANHWRQPLPSTARDRNLIVDPKGDPEAIESRSEIGSARRNTDGDLMHELKLCRAAGANPRAKREAIVTGLAEPARDGQRLDENRLR